MKIKISKVVSAIAILVMISCSYYTVKDVQTTKENISEQIENFNSAKKYVVIHSDSLSWHLKNMIINDDDQNITGTIEPINERHIYNKARDEKRVHRYKRDEKDPLNEIHFYLKTSKSFRTNSDVVIPLQEINRISVNDKNTGRAVANVALTTIGVVFSATIIAIALKSSCPFVYIKEGQEYKFVGELYPGTITPNMQRDDYLALPDFTPENDTYVLKIANQLKEIQYTDQLQLILVNHQKDVEVLLDTKGQLQSFRDIISPIKVIYDDKAQDLDRALKKDNSYYAFDSFEPTLNSTRNIIFEFNKPKDAKEAKLYLTAKNSVWLDYVFGKFNAQFGGYYNTFQKKQQTVKKEKLDQWREGQNIPLSIYVKTNDGWDLVERLNTVGPLAMRDLAVPINIDALNGEVLQIKLETGFMFWELDFVGVDFSKNLDLDMRYVDPVSAIDKHGNEVSHLLKSADNKYFVQPKIGDEVVVNFQTGQREYTLLETSVFLKNRGYYNYIRAYKGVPDLARLKSFKEDGAFTRFSEKTYFEFINYGSNNLVQNE